MVDQTKWTVSHYRLYQAYLDLKNGMPLKEEQGRDISMILKIQPSASDEEKARGIEEYFTVTLGQKLN